ncbi:DeoR/GlpR family DNA-binding transcription regulator [Collinsella sp. AGMB00827]|uniref:DeoR/GlpR family DNA-binding transcription regulator n=1 Tax=Collinsella ureilytica TaxID=2869515 RepID=A0ABS7MIL4_9ACTN|nr:DeoR/GlpR family DNA-binding transcription regulator [Collinsella urealyticum]
MFRRQRREKILEIINATGHATVEELAKLFHVSVDSIRKDLRELADAGLCIRAYGGATRIKPAATETEAHAQSPELQVTDNRTGRLAVAERAWEEINEGDAIFLDISQTNLLLAHLIAEGDKRLIVTTNMLEIPRLIAANPKVTVLATGGFLNPQLTGFTGTASISLLEPLLFSKAFIGVHGVHIPSNAVMSFNMDDGMVKRKVIDNASERFLLADQDKFAIESGYRFASVDDFSAIITDTTNASILSELEKRGIPILG